MALLAATHVARLRGLVDGLQIGRQPGLNPVQRGLVELVEALNLPGLLGLEVLRDERRLGQTALDVDELLNASSGLRPAGRSSL